MKKVLITGSSRGIGIEIVLALGRAGYQVFAAMRTPAKATEFLSKIKVESLPVSLHELDFNSDESVRSCIGSLIQKHGANQ